jgi:RluA family pseudouridine synthase
LNGSSVIKLSWPATQQFWEVTVLHEDEQMLALDKPIGLLTAPDPATPGDPNLLGLLHEGIHQDKPWARQRHLTYLMVAHRLEAEVGGAIVLARTKPALISLANSFGIEKPSIEFLALVRGTPEDEQFEVEAKLAPHPTNPALIRADSRHGKRARTLFSVVEKFSDWTLLRCQPLTHRPHQIRAHLRLARLPVAGDENYGGQPLLLSRLKSGYRLKPNRSERPLLDRPALHSEKIVLPHPVSGHPLNISAPWPKDLTVAIKYLRRYASGGQAVEEANPS